MVSICMPEFHVCALLIDKSVEFCQSVLQILNQSSICTHCCTQVYSRQRGIFPLIIHDMSLHLNGTNVHMCRNAGK